MQSDEITVTALLIWLLMIGLAGALVGWDWTLLAVGVGVLVGLDAAVASERARPRRGRTGKTRCPTCGVGLSDPERRAICPRCLADLKTNCPECGAVIEAKASRCPACRRALPSEPRTPFSS